MTVCQHPQCGALIPTKKFACDRHWYALPAHLRQALAAPYLDGQEFGLVEPAPEWKQAREKILAWWAKNA